MVRTGRHRCRCRRGGSALTIPDEALRPALELAFGVAVAGARLRPAIAPPAALRPYLRFQKLPAAALGPVRRAVEADEAFRTRTASVATEELVGRAGWLWLHRPDGWEAELADVVSAEVADEAAAGEAKAERAASKRLDAAEAATRRAVANLAAAQAELDAEQGRRRDAEAAQAALERRAAQLDVELGGARQRLTDALDQATKLAARAGEETGRADDALARLAVAEARLTEAEARARTAEAELELARRQPMPDTAGAHDLSDVPDGPGAPVELADRPAQPDRDALAAALRDAGEALAAAARALEPGLDDPCYPIAGLDERSMLGPPGQARRAPRVRRRRRTALPLPGGVLADSPEAALHLVRQPGVLLVVDGYNVAKLGWPDLALPLQRERLLDALEELATRHRAQVQVVFDGSDVRRLPSVRRRVRVDFSPPGVTADEVIVELVASTAADVPVVVATNDGQVREGARVRGANLISSQQLLAVTRR